MKILLLTPLFPPDTGDPAPYVKELATRLTPHDVTVLMYGRLPESVANTTLVAVDKRQWLPLRLFKYTKTLWRLSETADLVVVNNAPSTELPALLVSILRSKKMLLCESDPLAAASQSSLYKILHRLFKARCLKTIVLPAAAIYKKPEVLPFATTEENIDAKREDWWQDHLSELTVI